MSVQQAKVRADCINMNEGLTYQRNTSRKTRAVFMGLVSASAPTQCLRKIQFNHMFILPRSGSSLRIFMSAQEKHLFMRDCWLERAKAPARFPSQRFSVPAFTLNQMSIPLTVKRKKQMCAPTFVAAVACEEEEGDKAEEEE